MIYRQCFVTSSPRSHTEFNNRNVPVTGFSSAGTVTSRIVTAIQPSAIPCRYTLVEAATPDRRHIGRASIGFRRTR